MTIHRCKRCNYVYIDEEQEIPFEKVDDEYFKEIFCEKTNTLKLLPSPNSKCKG